MNKKPFALDADGVLFDCDKSFRVVGSAHLGRELTKLNNQYDLRFRYGVTEEEVNDIFQAMLQHEHGWGGMELMPFAKEAFLILQEDYDIHIVTAISEDIRALREESLNRYGLFPKAIHCAGHHAASKFDILKSINPVGFVDDRLRHLYESDFIEHRVWIDNGDHQEGLEVDDTLYRAESLLSWVKQWSVSQNRPARTRLFAVGGKP